MKLLSRNVLAKQELITVPVAGFSHKKCILLLCVALVHSKVNSISSVIMAARNNGSYMSIDKTFGVHKQDRT